MPNWVRNNVTVTGAPSDVEALKKQVGKATQTPGKEVARDSEGKNLFDSEGKFIYEKKIYTDEEPIFSMWNIKAPEGDELASYADGWYDWNCTNWGCKWDAKDVEVIDDSPGHWHLAFDTPWSPPSVFTELSRQHPNVNIYVEWIEEQGYGAEEVYEDGGQETIREWNIPESHEEQEENVGEGSCPCHYYGDSFGDYPFADCPRPQSDTQVAVAEFEKASELV